MMLWPLGRWKLMRHRGTSSSYSTSGKAPSERRHFSHPLGNRAPSFWWSQYFFVFQLATCASFQKIQIGQRSASGHKRYQCVCAAFKEKTLKKKVTPLLFLFKEYNIFSPCVVRRRTYAIPHWLTPFFLCTHFGYVYEVLQAPMTARLLRRLKNPSWVKTRCLLVSARLTT